MTTETQNDQAAETAHPQANPGIEADVTKPDRPCRSWSARAMRLLGADAIRSADTHLMKIELPEPGIDLYIKDETTHPTGSLKHRLARSLFLFAIANDWVREGRPVVEASSGSTAVSEAYFARMLGLPFIAVMPRSTSPAKCALIEREGGRCHFVDDPSALCSEATRLAAETGGHFMDQFTYAEQATDWRGNNNIAESIFAQLAGEPYPEPAWLVVGAGTGGTSATIGRYLRYQGHSSKLCVVDPEGSAFYEGWQTGDLEGARGTGSHIEGIGRPRVEKSFVPSVVDRMIKATDAASIAAARVLSEKLGRRVGGSTGTNLVGVERIIRELREAGIEGSVVTLLCDSGDRYEATYFNDEWLEAQAIDIEPHLTRYRDLLIEA